MLVLCPNIVVVMSGPELSSCPLRLHVIEMGLSPLETTHINWAKSPESITGLPNVNGTILGGAKTHVLLNENHSCKIFSAFPLTSIITIDFKISLKGC